MKIRVSPHHWRPEVLFPLQYTQVWVVPVIKHEHFFLKCGALKSKTKPKMFILLMTEFYAVSTRWLGVRRTLSLLIPSPKGNWTSPLAIQCKEFLGLFILSRAVGAIRQPLVYYSWVRACDITFPLLYPDQGTLPKYVSNVFLAIDLKLVFGFKKHNVLATKYLLLMSMNAKCSKCNLTFQAKLSWILRLTPKTPITGKQKGVFILRNLTSIPGRISQ